LAKEDLFPLLTKLNFCYFPRFMQSPEELAREKNRMAGMNISREARVVPLRELAAVVAGYSPRPDERKRSGKYLLLGGRNIKDGRLVRTVKDNGPSRSAQKRFFTRKAAIRLRFLHNSRP
jgi:hypothetical protein